MPISCLSERIDMSIEPSPRQMAEMRRIARQHKERESRRSRELDLLLTAGVTLEEAVRIVQQGD